MPISHSLNLSLNQVDLTSSIARQTLSLVVNDSSSPKNLTNFILSTLAPTVENFNLSLEDDTYVPYERDTGIQTNTQQWTPGLNVVLGDCKFFSKHNFETTASDTPRFINLSLNQVDLTSSIARQTLSLVVNDSSSPKNVTPFILSVLAPTVENFNLSVDDGEQTSAEWLILYDANGNAKNSIQPQQGSATIE